MNKETFIALINEIISEDTDVEVNNDNFKGDPDNAAEVESDALRGSTATIAQLKHLPSAEALIISGDLLTPEIIPIERDAERLRSPCGRIFNADFIKCLQIVNRLYIVEEFYKAIVAARQLVYIYRANSNCPYGPHSKLSHHD